MDEILLKLLEQAGFTDKESRVYLALLELGQGDVSDISKLTGLKRSIIYVILEGLIKRGYASRVLGEKINTYQAADPSVLSRQLQATAKNLSEMLPVLQTLRNKGKKRPRIYYVENKEGIWNSWQEMNYVKEPFFISSGVSIEKYFPGSVDYWARAYKKGIYKTLGRNLIPDNPNEKELGRELSAAGQKVRFLPGAKEFQMDFTIYGNKLGITSLFEEPFFISIESEDLVNAMRPIFEIAWKTGRPV